MAQCYWKTSVQPPPRGCLMLAEKHQIPWAGQCPAWAKDSCRFPRKGNGSGVQEPYPPREPQSASVASPYRKAPATPCSPVSPKLHLVRSISGHKNAVKYFWKFLIPSGISGTASCWEKSPPVTQIQPEPNATPRKSEVQASILSASFYS